jgi:isopentenyl-diphosphate delta-isomerase
MHNDRKSEHIRLAFEAQAQAAEPDHRFFYEPMLAAHPAEVDLSVNFLGKTMRAPIWVSSMTGGTGAARDINANIARACREFGLGMDWVRAANYCRMTAIGPILIARPDWPRLAFYANLGIAQVKNYSIRKSGRDCHLSRTPARRRVDRACEPAPGVVSARRQPHQTPAG